VFKASRLSNMGEQPGNHVRSDVGYVINVLVLQDGGKPGEWYQQSSWYIAARTVSANEMPNSS
jgi:hypothetical protein